MSGLPLSWPGTSRTNRRSEVTQPHLPHRSFRSTNPLASSRTSSLKFNCRNGNPDRDDPLTTSSAYAVLGVDPSCSPAQLKAAFRARKSGLNLSPTADGCWSRLAAWSYWSVKEFHPDVRKNQGDSDVMIRGVIKAYEMLSSYSRPEIIQRECLDPFDSPECEAFDIFVNEVMCAGKGCPYSCVKQAPHAFSFSSLGTARATTQGCYEDYQVQLAAGQCPRSCIHYVTPSQRIILEELLDSILDAPYDTSAEADLLYSLIVKAKYENNRYQRPKKQPPKASNQHVDWF